MTLFFYNREFSRDLIFDLSQAFNGDEVINKSLASKIIWALCKTNDNNVINYNLWIKIIQYDYSDSWKNIVINTCSKAFGIEKKEDSKNESVELTPREMALGILVNSKRMGLSFSELNILNLQDYIDFTDDYVGNNKTKKASQADIDGLYA